MFLTPRGRWPSTLPTAAAARTARCDTRGREWKPQSFNDRLRSQGSVGAQEEEARRTDRRRNRNTPRDARRRSTLSTAGAHSRDHQATRRSRRSSRGYTTPTRASGAQLSMRPRERGAKTTLGCYPSTRRMPADKPSNSHLCGCTIGSLTSRAGDDHLARRASTNEGEQFQ